MSRWTPLIEKWCKKFAGVCLCPKSPILPIVPAQEVTKKEDLSIDSRIETFLARRIPPSCEHLSESVAFRVLSDYYKSKDFAVLSELENHGETSMRAQGSNGWKYPIEVLQEIGIAEGKYVKIVKLHYEAIESGRTTYEDVDAYCNELKVLVFGLITNKGERLEAKKRRAEWG